MAVTKHILIWQLIDLLFSVCAATRWTYVLQATDLTVFNQANDTQTFGFYQQIDGSVSAFYRSAPGQSPDSPWSGGDNNIVLLANRAFYRSALASVHYQINGVDTYRLFYITSGNQVREVVWSSNSFPVTQPWQAGELDARNVLAAFGSQLSAVAWVVDGSPRVALYYQGQDSGIFQILYDNNGWATSTFRLPGDAVYGTKMSFVQVNAPGTPTDIRGYVQWNDLQVHELFGSGMTWYTREIGTNSANVIPRTAIAATAVRTASGPSIRVYYVNYNLQVLESVFTSSWGPPNIALATENSVVPGAGMSAVSFARAKSVDVRLYMQQRTNIFSELRILGTSRTLTPGLPGAIFATS